MNRTEEFFDGLASGWDKEERCPEDVKLNLLAKAMIHTGDHVLDIACGTGVVTELIHRLSKEEVTGIDLSSKMIQAAKEKYSSQPWAHFIHQDFYAMNESKKYDVAIIYNAYPHFSEPEKLAVKLSAVLNAGGRFAILHSMSREQLDRHHSQVAPDISRSLMGPMEEAKFFEKYFRIVECGEDETSFYIVGIRK